MKPTIRCTIATLTGALILIAALAVTTKNLGFAPGTYRGVIAGASPANGSSYMRVEQHSAVIHLEAISSIVLPN